MDIVTLVGARSVGKSTAGQIVAKSLGWKFIDLDEYMNAYIRQSEVYTCKETGKKKKMDGINDYTKIHCWQKYMQLLNIKLKELVQSLKGEKVVLDCGGGTTASEYEEESNVNRELLNKHSKIVLILPHEDEEKGLKILLERERHRKHFSNYTLEELEEKTRSDYFKRLPGMSIYAKGKIHTNDESPQVTAKKIEEFLKKNL